MRLFFPPQLGVGYQVVARPLPHVVEPAQGAAHSIIGDAQAGGGVEGVGQHGHRPAGVRVAQGLRRAGQQGLEQALLALAQQAVPAPAAFVL